MNLFKTSKLLSPPLQGLDCCSDYSITFHYIKPKEMYALEFLLYHLKKPYGVQESHPDQPKQLTWDEVLERNQLDFNEITENQVFKKFV